METKKKRLSPLSGAAAKAARDTAVTQILTKKSFTAAQLRRLWARASSAKRHILKVLAPELLDLRARQDALELLVLQGTAVADVHNLEEGRALLLKLKGEALLALPEDDLLQHLGGASREEVWTGVEDKMVADIYQKQKARLLNSVGVKFDESEQ